ncbi:MAG: hypothetical protein ACYCS9_06630 [Candidatus Dormibacteria bacterium]
MNEDEYGQLLSHIAQRVRERGLGLLGGELAAIIGDDPEATPQVVVQRFLMSLWVQSRMAGAKSSQAVLSVLSHSIHSEAGGRLQLVLQPTGLDREIYGSEPIPLSGDPRFDDFPVFRSTSSRKTWTSDMGE